MAENQFTSTIDTLFRGMDQFVNTKTVVGEPVQVGDTIIVPLVDVTCGMAGGRLSGGGEQNTSIALLRVSSRNSGAAEA